MLIVLAAIVAILFCIAGTFLSIEAKRAAATQKERPDSSNNRSAAWQANSASE